MKTYKDQPSWKKIQHYLPGHNRITKGFYPIEKSLCWNKMKIHIDFYPVPKSKVKIILLHGVGGNGRLLSFIGIPLFKNGYEVICPDLPGYGLTESNNNTPSYETWVNLVKFLISREIKKDNKKLIVLFGLSAGGMLAYHAGCNNINVAGLIFTNLLDQRLQKVRDYSASNVFIGRIGIHFLNFLSHINCNLRLPMKLVANMNAIVNDNHIKNILLKDKTSSGASIPVKLITSMINYNPEVEPEFFNRCPLLLAHPENDRWTDLSLSKLTFDKFKNNKDIAILQGAGHFPIEQPGLKQLETQTIKFINKILFSGFTGSNHQSL